MEVNHEYGFENESTDWWEQYQQEHSEEVEETPLWANIALGAAVAILIMIEYLIFGF
jgi:hypothetical protein